MQTSMIPELNEAGLVDRYVGTAYGNVRVVAENLPALITVSENLEDIVGVSEALAQLTTMNASLAETQALITSTNTTMASNLTASTSAKNQAVTSAADAEGFAVEAAESAALANAIAGFDVANYYTKTQVDGLFDTEVIEQAQVNGLVSSLTTINTNITDANTSITSLSTSTTNALAGKADTTHVHSLNALSDVVISNPVTGQTVVYDGTDWDNKTLRSVTLGPFHKADMAADDTAALSMMFAQTPASSVTFDRAMKMPRAGRIVGGYLALDSARTGGTCTLRVSINGSVMDFAAGAVQLNATDKDSNSAEVPYSSGVAFAAGDDVKAAVTTSIGWTVSSGNDLIGWLTVVYDPF